MKRLKNVIAVLLVCLLAIPSISIVYANTADDVPPEIIDVSFENYDASNVYTADDIIEAKIVASDNIQLERTEITFRDSEERDFLFGGYSFNGDLNTDDPNNTFFTVRIPVKELPSGTYTLVGVQVNDASGKNDFWNMSNSSKQFVFNVENPNYGQFDFTGKPRITSIELSPKSGNSKTTEFKYTLNVEKGDNEIDRVMLTAQNMVSSGVGFDFQKTANPGEYVCIINVAQELSHLYYINKIVFEQITIVDTADNWYYYMPEDELQNAPEDYLPIYDVSKDDLSITLNDIEPDNELPELIEFEYSRDIIYTPDMMKINITASDESSIPVQAFVTIKEKGAAEDEWAPRYEVMMEGEETKTRNAVLSIDYPRYGESGEFYVSEIVVKDAFGNENSYSVKNGDFEEKYYEVKDNAIEIDHYTSTTDKDLLNVINKAVDEGGKTVLVNVDTNNSIAPKALFDAIATKDIVVIFEKMYDYSAGSGITDEGLQWIIRGVDVKKNKTKDVDVYFYMEEAVDTSWLEKNEKRFGTPAPVFGGGERPADMDKHAKEVFTESGWGDLIPEVEAKRQKDEGWLEAFNRLAYVPYTKVVFADNGELPGKSTIRLKPAYSMRYWMDDYNLKLFYYDEDKDKFVPMKEKVDKNNVDEYYEFVIHHNSTYALMDASYETGEDGSVLSSTNAVNTGDDSNLLIPIVVGLIALALGSGIFATRKKYN